MKFIDDSGKGSEMNLSEMLSEEVNVERIRHHIRELEGVRHPQVAPEALDKAADYISDHLSTLGYEMSTHHFPDNGCTFSNIIATRAGIDSPDERVLIVAHFDTVSTSPGADDNASGVAGMLEAATLLAKFSFGKTVQFVGVNLEENAKENESGTGTRGSRALASHARELGWNIAGVMVLESIAFASEEAIQTTPSGVPVKVPETGDFIAVIGNERSKVLVDGFSRACSQSHINLPHFPLTLPGNGEMLPDTRRSDHAPFWDNGFPAIMLTDTTNFRNPHYHQPTDTLETLNLDFAAKVCAATIHLVTELAEVKTASK